MVVRVCRACPQGSTGFVRGRSTADRVIPAIWRYCIGARDYNHVHISTCIQSGTDLLDMFIHRHALLAFEKATAFGEYLILQVHCRRSRRLIFTHSALRVYGITVASIRIGYYRNINN